MEVSWSKRYAKRFLIKNKVYFCMTAYRFRKSERLKSYKLIQRMFGEGQSFGVYPLRFVWLPREDIGENIPVQVAFAVGKKHFRSAVTRNRIRRRVREAWRLNSLPLRGNLDTSGGCYALMVIYIARTEEPFGMLETSMSKGVRKLQNLWTPNG